MERRMRDRTLALVAMLVMVAAAVGCGRGDDGGSGDTDAPARGATKTEIKIGGSFPLSGPLAVFGTASKGFNAYVQALNEKGGVNGRKIAYTALDDGYDPARAVSNVRRLVQRDEVFALVTFGAPSVPTQPVANQAKTPQIVLSGGSAFSEVDKNPYTRAWWPDIANESAIIARQVIEEDPDAKIGTLVINNDAGLDYSEGVKEALGSEHAENLVKETKFEATDVSVSSQLNQLRSAGVDTVISLATGAAQIQMLKYIDQIKWTPKTYIYGPSTGILATMSQAGSAGEGVNAALWLKDPGDPQWEGDAGLEQYRADIETHGDGADPADVNTANGYGAAAAMVEILEGLDAPSQDAFLEAWDELSPTDLGLLQPGIQLKSGEGGRLIHQYQLVTYDGKSWKSNGEPVDAPE